MGGKESSQTTKITGSTQEDRKTIPTWMKASTQTLHIYEDINKGQHMRLEYLLHQQAARAQTSLRISLLAYTNYGG